MAKVTYTVSYPNQSYVKPLPLTNITFTSEMASETTPLVSTDSSVNNAPTAYFLDGAHHRRGSSISSSANKGRAASPFPGATAIKEEEELNTMPKGSIGEEFKPRPVGKTGASSERHKMKAPSVGGDWLSYIADMRRPRGPFAPTPGKNNEVGVGDIGTLLIPRKVPVKVEPKVHLANERTFLAWLHVVVILAAASMTIVSYSSDEDWVNQLYGIVLLPVSIAFIFYSLLQCEYLVTIL